MGRKGSSSATRGCHSKFLIPANLVSFEGATLLVGSALFHALNGYDEKACEKVVPMHDSMCQLRHVTIACHAMGGFSSSVWARKTHHATMSNCLQQSRSSTKRSVPEERTSTCAVALEDIDNS